VCNREAPAGVTEGMKREVLKPRFWMFSPTCYLLELVAIVVAFGATTFALLP
jgi:hypothetical protein